MNIERKEPTYAFTEKQVAEKSEIARRFLEMRTRLNMNVDEADNFLETVLQHRSQHVSGGYGSGEVQGVDGVSGLGRLALR